MPLGLRKAKTPADPMHPKFYKDVSVTLHPGDTLIQFTDGVTEAVNTDGELFGEQGLLEAVKDAPSTEPKGNYSGRDAHLLRGCDPPTWFVERGVTFHALLRQRRALLFRVPEQ